MIFKPVTYVATMVFNNIGEYRPYFSYSDFKSSF